METKYIPKWSTIRASSLTSVGTYKYRFRLSHLGNSYDFIFHCASFNIIERGCLILELFISANEDLNTTTNNILIDARDSDKYTNKHLRMIRDHYKDSGNELLIDDTMTKILNEIKDEIQKERELNGNT